MDKITKWDLDKMSAFLQDQGLMSVSDQVAEITKAGEGNMNCTLRVTSEQKNFIVKQSPPYCEKYPDIPAPKHRVGEEFKFYKLAAQSSMLQKFFPEVFSFDQTRFIVVMEDLGEASDFESLYTGEKIQEADLKKLVDILSCLHFSYYEESFSNKDMRALNHNYIFTLPFEDRSFDLDPITKGLQKPAQQFLTDPILAKKVAELGQIYLADGNYLVHGDFYPRSWIKTERGFFVIDPEFGYLGAAEFDVGVLMAHLVLSGQDDSTLDYVWSNYGPGRIWDKELALGFCGAEIIRRLTHVAQLPLSCGLETKMTYLERAKQFVLKGEF
jgi:5-methylthioribose kinase